MCDGASDRGNLKRRQDCGFCRCAQHVAESKATEPLAAIATERVFPLQLSVCGL